MSALLLLWFLALPPGLDRLLRVVLGQWVAAVGGCWWQQLCHSILAALVPPASRFLHLRGVQHDADDSVLFWGFLCLPPAL